jgi:DNA polymerase III subunit gamma/tau
VTVLSRCLQFNLKRLDEEQIAGQIDRDPRAEGIEAETGAIAQLARAADGSLRDGLSLLDQAIAYTGATMLGTVDRARVGALLEALAAGEGDALLAEVETLAGFSPDWAAVLDALAAALHRLQVRQLVPGALVEEDGQVDFASLAGRLRPELVQLWYQMALAARRDLPLAPSPRTGFEMGVLRMLAFRPVEESTAGARNPGAAGGARAPGQAAGDPVAAARAALAAPAGPRQSGRQAAGKAQPPDKGAVPHLPDAKPHAATSRADPAVRMGAHNGTPGPSPSDADGPRRDVGDGATTGTRRIGDAEGWLSLVAECGLRGPVRELAAHAVFVGHDEAGLRLALSPDDEHLRMPTLVGQLEQALSPALGAAPRIRFESAPAPGETLHQRSTRERDACQAAAEEAFANDPGVQQLVLDHGARIVPDSIRPIPPIRPPGDR